MPLTTKRVLEQAQILYNYQVAERQQLNEVRRYWKGLQRLPAVIPSTGTAEVRVMARSSRVNVMPIVVNSLVQSTFVDGYRAARDADDLDVWGIWQKNRMDARQTAIHRAAFAYGTSYAIVLPGDPVPVIKPASPRALTVLYGEDLDWPLWALENLGHGLWRLFDNEAIYYLSRPHDQISAIFGTTSFEYIETREHGVGVTPIVRYVEEADLDDDDEVTPGLESATDNWLPFTRGQVAPLMSLQDQIDLTTFGLQIAQHFGAFRQRYIIGWVAEDETKAMKAAASQLWAFDKDPDEMKVGEFEQTNLDGYIKSREASLRHAATLSQTPVHELIGELVNLSAEALAAAEAGRDRKVDERKTLLGEAHEQTLSLAGRLAGVEVPDDAQVVWRDTSARAFAATVDALGKLTQMLGIPQQELWERVPGATRQDLERWREASQQGDAFSDLAALLDRQAD